MSRIPVVLLSLIAASFLISGCGETQKTDVVTLRFTIPGSVKDMSVLDESVTRFESLHPKIRVVREYAPWSLFRDKLLCAVAGGKPPDVTRVSAVFFSLCADQGLFEPLDDFVKSDKELNLPDFYEPVLDAWAKYDGHWYCIPNSLDLYVLFYNKTMFDRYHVPYPDDSWDWKRLLYVAQKLSKDLDGDGRLDQWGVSADASLWPEFVWQNGGEVYSADGRECLLYRPESYDGLQFVVDLQRKHHVAPTPDDTADITADGLFSNGQLGMFIRGAATVVRFNEQIKDFDWDMAPLPAGKKHAQWIYGSGFGIVKGTKHRKEAWELVKYLTSPEAQMHWALLRQDAPVRRSVAESREYMRQKGRPEHRVFISDVMKWGKAYPVSSAIPEVTNEIVSNELSLAILGKESVPKACKRAARRANQLLVNAHH